MGLKIGDVFKKDEETLVIDRKKPAIRALIILSVIIVFALAVLMYLKNLGDVDETRRLAITKDIQQIQSFVRERAKDARNNEDFVYPGFDLNVSGEESAFRLNVNGYEEEFRYGYYYLNPADYSSIHSALNLNNEYYIVNYNTSDVINIKGIKYDDGRYHSIDDILVINKIKEGLAEPGEIPPSRNTRFIKTPQDMNLLHTYPNSNFKLVGNIDMSAYSANAGWKPVKDFNGNFDGRGYTISNLTINRSTERYVGLFSNFTGSIKNLQLKDVDIVGETYTGALAGTMLGNVTNVIVEGGSVVGSNQVGGLAGACQGEIENCKVDIDLVAGETQVGGIVGLFNSGRIQKTKANIVAINASSDVGGFVGCITAKLDTTMQECVATIQTRKDNPDAISSIMASSNIGGLIGKVDVLAQSMLVIKDCYSVGNIQEGTVNQGGIIGLLNIGSQGAISLNSIYTAFTIAKKTESSGGCIGSLKASDRVSSKYVFWEKDLLPGEVLEDIGGQGDSNKIEFTSKRPDEMRTRSTYTDWDFDIWEIEQKKSRPTLKFEKSFIEY